MTDQAQETIFTDPATQVPAQSDVVVPIIQVPDAAVEFVGEGKKYSTVDAALTAIPHAQSHISKLEVENARLRDEASKVKTAEQILQEIKANQQPLSTPEPVPVDSSALVTQTLAALNAQKDAEARNTNVLQASTDAQTKYGEKAKQVTLDIANKLNISLGFMQSIAAESPAAFAKLLADNTNLSSTLPPQTIESSVNTAALAATTPADALPKPIKSVMSGASTAELNAEMQRCKQLAEREMNT